MPYTAPPKQYLPAVTQNKHRSIEFKEKNAHIIVKLYPGKSEEQKIELTEAIVKSVMATLDSAEKSISVSIEEVEPADWKARVYQPDILDKPDKLYKKPGYNPSE